jgi:hypothetical protein
MMACYLLLLQGIWSFAGELRKQLGVEELLCTGRSGNIGAFLGSCLAFVRVVTCCGCQPRIPEEDEMLRHLSRLRHFWHCTFDGVALDGPLRARYGCIVLVIL